MANPPITIGELTDVPAPGSPIASPWAQEISNRVVQRFATVAAMNAWAAADGSVAFTPNAIYVRALGVWHPMNAISLPVAFTHAGVSGISAAGGFDLGTTSIPAKPYARAVTVTIRTQWGFAAGTVSAIADLVVLNSGASLGASGVALASSAMWASTTAVLSYAVPAGVDAGFKSRITFQAISGGIANANAAGTYQVSPS